MREKDPHLPEVEWLAEIIQEMYEEHKVKDEMDRFNFDVHCAEATIWASMYPGAEMPRSDTIRGKQILAFAHGEVTPETSMWDLATELHAKLVASKRWATV